MYVCVHVCMWSCGQFTVRSLTHWNYCTDAILGLVVIHPDLNGRQQGYSMCLHLELGLGMIGDLKGQVIAQL